MKSGGIGRGHLDMAGGDSKLAGFSRIFQDLAGFSRIWRDYPGFGGIFLLAYRHLGRRGILVLGRLKVARGPFSTAGGHSPARLDPRWQGGFASLVDRYFLLTPNLKVESRAVAAVRARGGSAIRRNPYNAQSDAFAAALRAALAGAGVGASFAPPAAMSTAELGFHCCAQFAVMRDAVLAHPRRFYEVLLEGVMSDNFTFPRAANDGTGQAHFLEPLWQAVFGGDLVDMPDVACAPSADGSPPSFASPILSAILAMSCNPSASPISRRRRCRR